jgi:uncharacterized protein YkwD
VLKSLIALAALVALLIPATVLAGATQATAGMSRNESTLLRTMNRVRAQHGLGQLRPDLHLERAARSHSREMIATNAFEHGAFGARMTHFDVHGRLAGENLAWGIGYRATPRAIVAAWLASPEHRANLLRPSFRRVGIGNLVGAFQGNPGATVVTADFAG